MKTISSFCDVQEIDPTRKQSYEAHWLSLLIHAEPAFMWTQRSEVDAGRRERLEQHHSAHLLLETSLGQRVKPRLRSGDASELQRRDQLRLSSGASARAAVGSKPSPNPGQREAAELRKPPREDFRASGLMASPSERVQRRE